MIVALLRDGLSLIGLLWLIVQSWKLRGWLNRKFSKSTRG